MTRNKKMIRFFGAPWCADCKRAEQYFDALNVSYEYINIDTVPGAVMEVMKITNGLQSIPTIVFPDNTVLIEPSQTELKRALEVTRTDSTQTKNEEIQ